MSVVCIGDNCIDRYLSPVRHEAVGGNAVNVAVNLAHAGRSVRYAGGIGADREGEAVIAALRAAGVDVSLVELVPGEATAVTLVELTDDRDRVFVEERFGATGAYRAGRATMDVLASAEWVHGAGPGGGPAALEQLEGRPCSYDFSHPHQAELFTRLCPSLEIAFFSGARLDRDAAVRIARSAVTAGAAAAVVTRGVEGVLSYDGTLTERPAQPVAVVDTLGAGDALIAGVIDARLRGAGFGAALEAGARSAAHACTHYGAWEAA